MNLRVKGLDAVGVSAVRRIGQEQPTRTAATGRVRASTPAQRRNDRARRVHRAVRCERLLPIMPVHIEHPRGLPVSGALTPADRDSPPINCEERSARVVRFTRGRGNRRRWPGDVFPLRAAQEETTEPSTNDYRKTAADGHHVFRARFAGVLTAQVSATGDTCLRGEEKAPARRQKRSRPALTDSSQDGGRLEDVTSTINVVARS